MIPTPHTRIGHSTTHTIEVCGYDLPGELMGTVDFAALFFLMVTGRLPGNGEARLFNSVLVALADHGLTPSALAARLTYTGAPEAVQGALAAGLLGGGSVILGAIEDAGRMLRAASPAPDATDSDLQTLAGRIVDDHQARKARIPGIGHPIHTEGDPRTTRLCEIAVQEGLLGVHIRLLLRIQAVASTRGRGLPINAAGASGAILCDLGVDANALRGVALVARSAGLVGHLVEEARTPLGRWLWNRAERDIPYIKPE